MPRERQQRGTSVPLGVALFLAFATPAEAAKTDIVVLQNGDRITCEIDQLERGRLRLKTDDMGTLEVEWDKVASVTAAATFEIEDLEGRRYYAALDPPSRPGELNLVGSDGRRTLELLTVGRISRLGETFLKRLDGSIDIGASYTSASKLFQFDVAVEARYERPGYEVSADLSTTLTRQPDVEDVQRVSLGMNFLGRRPNRWLYFGQGLLEQNRELGFDLRTSLGIGFGRYMIQSRRDDLLSGLGLSVNHEVPVEGDHKVNTEALVAIRYNRFSYDFPKTDVQVSLLGYKSVSDRDRIRAEMDASLRREVLKDFNITLRAYESYDNRPPTEGAESNDFGLTLAVGWSY